MDTSPDSALPRPPALTSFVAGTGQPTFRWYQRPEGEAVTLRKTPRLTSWDGAIHPAQIRLNEYLDDTVDLVSSAQVSGPWCLRLDVGLPPGRDLFDQGDLDNFALPLASRIRTPDLVSVWYTKHHADLSQVLIAAARETAAPTTPLLTVRATGSTGGVAYKEQVRAAVASAGEIPAGPVRLEVAFVVGPHRNWLNLWKSTIDALDPLLGRTYANSDWNPKDGRITELGLHASTDRSIGHDVLIAIAATSAA